VDGVRSAEPPMSQGTFFATAFSTWPEDSRPPRPLDPEEKRAGSCPSHRQRPALHLFNFIRQLRKLASVLFELGLPRCPKFAAPLADALLEVYPHASGTRNFASSGQP